MKKLTIIALIASLYLSGCSSQKDIDPITGQEKLPEVNPQERAKEFAKKGGGILGDFSKSRNTTYDFTTSNVMWRATLKTLNFIPFQSIDYAGGFITTDWYSSETNPNESIKINVNFLTDKVSANSFEVRSFKKICNASLTNCKTIKLNDNFNNEIKDKIMKEIVNISIEDKKKN